MRSPSTASEVTVALSVDEVRFLARTPIEQPKVVETGIAVVEKLRATYDDYGRAVAELLAARASGKVPSDWLVDSDSAQQATPEPIARERAARLSGRGVIHDVTCSVGTEGRFFDDSVTWIGSDLSEARLLMAQHNLPSRSFLRADATVPTTRPDVVVADPARRSGGRRISDPAQLIPPLPTLLETWPDAEMAVKCAPGIDYSKWPGLVTVSSVDGGVKETCLYTPGLVFGEERREALVHSGGAVDRLTDLMSDDVAVGGHGRYIVDPDGAIVRAGLVRHFAAREGLWMLDERIAYLTGDRIPAGYTGFEVREQVPLKKLKAAVAAHDAGSAEILVRGVDVNPDQLRKKLKLSGSQVIGIVITRIGKTAVAFVCGPRSARN